MNPSESKTLPASGELGPVPTPTPEQAEASPLTFPFGAVLSAFRFRTMAARVPLRRKDGSVLDYMTVDKADEASISRHRWHLSQATGYAQRRTTAGTVLAHRQIVGLTRGDGLDVDHINGDKLDNRRANLRALSHAENSQNRRGGNRGNRYSQHRGVSWHKTDRRWVAMVKLDGKLHNLGRFTTEDEAAGAARAFRREHMPYSEDAA